MSANNKGRAWWSSLNKDQKASALEPYFKEGKKNTEIAEELEIGPGAVSSVRNARTMRLRAEAPTDATVIAVSQQPMRPTIRTPGAMLHDHSIFPAPSADLSAADIRFLESNLYNFGR